MSLNWNAHAWIAASVFVLTQSFSFHAHAAKESKPTTKPDPKAPIYYPSIPNQYVVRLTHDVPFVRTSKEFVGMEERLGASIKEVIRPNLILVERRNKESRTSGLASIRGNREVVSADPNYIYQASKTPNDVDYSKLWGMSNAGEIVSNKRGLKGVDISAERAWELTTGSRDVVVAIIDTGIDFKIPDLAPNAWTNEKELNGVAGVDDDGNGYVDDIHGYDFVNNDGDPTDDNGHGSHCAGTIGAKGDDGIGVAGVNWNVSLMAVKFLSATGSGSLANAIKAIDYARINGAQISSNSWGGGPFVKALFDAIELTNKADQLFIAAAGNDGRDIEENPAYPASYELPNIISVAALDARGDLADFSNYGLTRVDLAAPGVGIYSTVPGGFDTYNGTSMATPHVSGVAALVLSANPGMSALDLKSKILSSVRPLRTLKGKVATGGMLDAYLSLSGDPAPQDPNDASVWIEKSLFSIATPHPYIDGSEQIFTIQIPGAKRISAHFPRFETESGYDLVQFLNAAGENLGTWSGEKNDSFSPIADGDTLVLKFKSDSSVNAYGFEIDSVSIER